ncbi:hypothetical protein B0J17DRAFT_134896 [Rhizoctonia solani]|nr:hypothetical protein B0J17DRAFT_134896 [Rhizoctonia solani]
MSDVQVTGEVLASFIPPTTCALPNELLVHIFFWVCFQNLHTARDCTDSSPKFPTTLTLVCHRWRQLARNIPVLWSNIDLLVHQANDSKHLALTKTLSNGEASPLGNPHHPWRYRATINSVSRILQHP